MKNLAYFFIVSISIVVILIFGRSILIPFVFALLLWFFVRKIRQALNKIKFIKEKMPSWVTNLVTSAIMLFIFGVISRIVLSNISELVKSYPLYESNLGLIVNDIDQLLGVNIIDEFKSFSEEYNFGILLKSAFKSLTDLLSNAFMIILYMLFIFLEESSFQNKLQAILKRDNQKSNIVDILSKIEASISNYIGVKTLVSLSTGIISYFALLIIGIDSPVFWGFLIFLLNFIPTIGSLIATLFPTAFCFLQFGEFMPGILVLFIVGSIQIVIGNILEPRIMGNSLNISPLVAIVSLVFWGAIWGVTGMLLSVPITVIMIIAFSHFEKTKPIAMLLSEKGKIN